MQGRKLLRCSVVHGGGGTVWKAACLQLCNARTSWPWYRQEGPNRKESVLWVFFNSSKYTGVLRAKVKIQAISVTKWVLVSLSEGQPEFSPCNGPSIQLRPSGMAPVEAMYYIFSLCFFFPEHSSKVRVHALGTSHVEAEVLSVLKNWAVIL